MNFGAEPLDGVSCCDWTFVRKGSRHPPCLLVGRQRVGVSSFWCKCETFPLHLQLSCCPILSTSLLAQAFVLAELRFGTVTKGSAKREGRGWGWVLRWCGVPHCPRALFGLQVFLAASVLRSTPALGIHVLFGCLRTFRIDLSYCASVEFRCQRTVSCLLVHHTLGDVTPFWSLVTRDVLCFFH